MHLALAKHLTPDHNAAYAVDAASKARLALLNDMVTGQAGFVAMIDRFKILMIGMLVAGPLVLLLRKPRPAHPVAATDAAMAQRSAEIARVRSMRDDRSPYTAL
jgi:hypothetical protein